MRHRVTLKQNMILIKQLQNQIKSLGGILTDNKSSEPPSRANSYVKRPSSNTLTPGSNAAGKPAMPRKTSSPHMTPPTNGQRRLSDASPRDMQSSQAGTPLNESVKIEESTEEVVVMGMKIGTLQQKNFELELHVNNLGQEIKKLKEESSIKSRVITKHLSEMKVQGRANSEMERNRREIHEAKLSDPLVFVGSLFNSDPLQDEAYKRIGSLLEDTLMQNIQLQDDMRGMGDEVDKLMLENKNLKHQLVNIQKLK